MQAESATAEWSHAEICSNASVLQLKACQWLPSMHALVITGTFLICFI